MSNKLIIFLTTIALFVFIGNTYGQVNNTNKGAAVIYTTGLPTGAVRLKYDSEVAINTTNGKFYRYDRTNSVWIEAGSSIGYLNSGAAPSGVPKYGGPELIINNDKELYWYYGGVWNCVNCAALGYVAGTGINITGTTITNTLPDQTVVLNDSTGILVTGTYPDFTITNTAPDQTVTITGAGISSVTGSYPNFTITSTEVDGSIINEIQRIDSLYLSNDTLFISLLNDALPASAIKLTGLSAATGGGIYGQSDTVTYQHLAVIDSGLTFSSTEDTAYFNIVTAPGAFGSAGYFRPDSIRLRHYDIGGSNELILNDDGVLLKTTTPDRVTIEGNDARYAADYRATYSDRSLVDKEYGDDFYLQEIDTFRVSNDTLYISLIRDSVPESFVVLPAGSGSAINLYELDIITPLPAVDVEGSMVLKTVDVNGSKILYVSNGTDWVEGGLFLDTLNVATINIGNDQVTYAKIQEVTAERLLGNPTGSTANPSEISLGSGLGFSGSTILNTGDLSTTNEIQQLDTFEIVSNVLRASLGLDGVPFKSVDLSPYLDNTDSSGYNSAFTRSGDTLFITDGLSTKFVVLPSGIVDTDDQTLSLSNDTLYISQGNSVFLGQYLDNTDSQQLSIDSSIVEGVERFEISLDSSTSIYFDVPQVTDTDNQTIDTFSITNAIISLSLQDDALPASTIDITESVQDITGTMVESNTETGIAVTYDDGTGKLNFVAVDQSITNEIQTLDTFEIVSDALIASMLNDGVPFKSVDLSPYLDNTDTSGYNISFTRSNDTLYLNDGDGQLFVKLPADQIGVDTSGSNYTFTRSNDTLFIADQNGILSVKLPTDNIGLDTSGYNLDFSRSNDTLFIRDGNGILSVKLPASVSTDTSGYNLDFRISDDSLYIRDGQDELFVNLDPYLDNTDTSGSNYTFTRSNDTLFIADQDGILSVKLPADNIGLDTSGYNLEFIRSNDTLYLRDGDGILSVKLPESVSTDTSGYNLQVRISGDTLYIRDGDGELFVDLADYLDNTDAQNLTIEGSGPTYDIAISGGTDITVQGAGIITLSETPANTLVITGTEVDGSITNEIQNLTYTAATGVVAIDGTGSTDATISVMTASTRGLVPDGDGSGTDEFLREDGTWAVPPSASTDLTIGGSGPTYTIESSTGTDVTIQASGITLSESPANTLIFTAVDGSITNEIQRFDTFEIVSNVLRASLLNDGLPFSSVSLSAYLDNTDNQTLDTFEIISNILRASNFGDGVPFKSVDLSPYLDNTDAQTLTIDSTDLVGVERYEIDISGGNTIYLDDDDNQTLDTLSLSGSTLSVSVEEDGVPAKTVDLSGLVVAADVVTLEDSAALKAYTGAATAIMLKQYGREGMFIRQTTSRAHDGFMVFTDGNSNKWVRVTEGGVLNVKWFGATGNGTTDDYWAIQRAIDYSVYEDTTIKKVFLPSGNYSISRTIHMGYGASYSSISLVGDGTPTFRGEQQFNGATITTTFSNGPAINIQGARKSEIRNVSFVGLNDIVGYWFDTSSVNLSNWIDPTLDTIGDNRYTPYAAITIDAYSGAAPTPAYPNISFPDYSGISTQYNKFHSSQVTIDNVHIYKFIAGIVVKPNSDNNGDFVYIRNSIIERSAYGISVGNSQARNIEITGSYIDAHTAITNSTHGAQIGRITKIENNHFGGYQWFDLQATAYLEGLEINNCYGESFYWVGTIGTGAIGAFPTITFNGCKFQSGAVINKILTPTANLTGSTAFNFNHCSFTGNRIYLFENDQAALINLNQCIFASTPGLGEPGDTVQTHHTKYYRGFDFVMATNPDGIRVSQGRFHETSNTAGGGLYPATKGDNTTLSTNINYGNFWSKTDLDGSDITFADLGFISVTNTLTGFTGGVSLSDRTFTGISSSNFQQGIGPGDLLIFQYDNNTLPVVVSNVSGLTITGEIMTGYAYATGGAFAYMLQDTNISTGYVKHFSSRKLLNKKTVFGDFTSGSQIVTGVTYTFDGSAAADELEVYTPLLNADGYLNVVSSPVAVSAYIDSIISSTSFRISSVATKTGRYEIKNCFLGTNTPNEFTIPVQQIVYGNGTGPKTEAEFNYDSTNNRINLNTTSGTRQLNLGHKAGMTTSNGGILMSTDGTLDADPSQRIEFTAVGTGPYTQRGYIGFDGFSNGGATPKGQALVFGLTTDGQSVLGTTSLSESQLAVNNSSNFTIANNLGRLRIQATSAGLYSTDVPWLLTNSSYTTNDATARLKVVGASADSSSTNYGLSVFNGFNQRTFSVRNDGNTIVGGRTVASELQILEATGSGTNYTGFKAQPMSANLVYTLPAAAGTAGQQLTWNSGDILTWESAGGSTTNIYNSDGDIKAGGTILDASGNDGLYFLVDNAAAANDYVIRMAADYAADDAISHWFHTTTGTDSLDIYSYDDGLYVEWEGTTGVGEGFTISSNTILNLTADSVLVQTLPTRTTLPYLVGLQGNTLSKIEGTTDGQTLVWDETNGGFWEIGTASAGGNGIYGGSDTIPDGVTATLTATGSFQIAYDGGLAGLELRDDDGSAKIQDKTGANQISMDATGTLISGSDKILNINQDYFKFYTDTGIVRLALFEPSDSGTNYTMFIQPALSSNQTYALPTDAPNNGEFLRWNTGGQLDWAAASGSLSDGDYGDIDVTSGGTVLTVDTSSVNNVKLASGAGGIYKGNGTIASGAVATVTAASDFAIDFNGGNTGLLVSDVGSATSIFSKDNTQFVSADNTQVIVGSGTSKMEYIDGVMRLYDSDATQYVAIQTPATGSLTANYTLTLPVDDGTSGQYLQTNGSGALSWQTISGSGDILNGGNTTGAAVVIGTNDANRLDFEVNNVVGLSLGTTYDLTATASVAATNTVTDRHIIITNVTGGGVASAGFGSGILFQGESSTTDNQDMARITSAWTTATHASKEAKVGVQLGNNGGALAEIANFNVQNDAQGALSIGSSTPVLIYNDGITTQTSFTLGGSSSLLTLGGSSGQVTTTSTANAANAVQIQASNTSASGIGSIRLGPTGNVDQTSGTRNIINTTTGFAPTSGTAVHNTYEFSGTFNQTGGANGITRGLYLNQVLTAVVDFRALEIAANGTNGKAIYQTGATMTNNFVGGIAAGTTSAPNASAQIDIVSTTKGLGIPSMTDAQRDAIGSPREGLVVYTTDQDALSLRDNGIWKRLPTTRTILKTADETVNNSSTYQADDALVFTAKANKKYVVKYFLYVEDVAFNGSNGAMKLKITAPSATTVRYGATGGAGLAAAYGDSGTDITVTDIFGSTPNEGHVIVTAYINPGASDRTVTLEWAQITADASDTKILEGSFLEYEEIN